MSERQLGEGVGAEKHPQSSCFKIKAQRKTFVGFERVWGQLIFFFFPEIIILHFTTIALNRLSLNPWKKLNYVA